MTLTLAGSNYSNAAFSGIIEDGAGKLSLDKIGTAGLNIGAPIAYTGSTTISGGHIWVINAGSLVGSPVTVNTNGLLYLERAAGPSSLTNSVDLHSVSLRGGSLALRADLAFDQFLAPDSTGGALMVDTGSYACTAGGRTRTARCTRAARNGSASPRRARAIWNR